MEEKMKENEGGFKWVGDGWNWWMINDDDVILYMDEYLKNISRVYL